MTIEPDRRREQEPGQGRRRLWLWVSAGLLVLAAVGLGVVRLRSRPVLHRTLGQTASTTLGVVTVHSWKASEPGSATGVPAGSEIDVLSCRSVAGGTVLQADAFAIELVDGRQLPPSGARFKTPSRFEAGRANCVGAQILFRSGGAKPRLVVFHGESAVVKWQVE